MRPQSPPRLAENANQEALKPLSLSPGSSSQSPRYCQTRITPRRKLKLASHKSRWGRLKPPQVNSASPPQSASDRLNILIQAAKTFRSRDWAVEGSGKPTSQPAATSK